MCVWGMDRPLGVRCRRCVDLQRRCSLVGAFGIGKGKAATADTVKKVTRSKTSKKAASAGKATKAGKVEPETGSSARPKPRAKVVHLIPLRLPLVSLSFFLASCSQAFGRRRNPS